MAEWRWTDGARLSLTLLTVLPVPSRPGEGAPSRPVVSTALSLAPVVGALLGLIAGGVGLVATWLGASPLLGAVLTIGATAALTRGLHLDGLADTADALGAYRDPEQALAIMKKPDIGPFGVVTIVLVLLAEVAAAAGVLTRDWPVALLAVIVATTSGRVAIAAACRRGVPAARPTGLGALAAGTVPAPVIALAALATGALAIAAVPGRPWQGPVAVALGLLAAAGGVRHCVRRFGGITGDVLGAACEAATAVTYIVLSM